MVKEILIEKPHPGQLHLIMQAKRFNVVCCGRRFGKTVFAKRRIVKRAYEQGKKIAYFAPTYKMLAEVWREIDNLLAPVILKRNVQEKQLITLTGGIIDFWSLDNIDAARGRSYHEILVDECAVIPNLLAAWETSLRPLLTDHEGKAWFLSTPKGFANDFKTLFDYGLQFPDWASFQMPTSTNPRISKSELEQVRSQLPDYAYRQEYEASFVVYQGALFADHFSREKHLTSKDNFNPDGDLYLSFDFNITNSCLVCQHDDEGIYILREYREQGWDLQRLCMEIQSDYPESFIIIHGDASGNSRSALTSGNETAYELISSFMGISYSRFMVPSVNPSLINSRLTTNYLLKNYKVQIHESCKGLITDLEAVQTDEKGGIDQKQKKTQTQLGHLLDCLRYYFHASHAKKVREYAG